MPLFNYSKSLIQILTQLNILKVVVSLSRLFIKGDSLKLSNYKLL